MRRMVSKEQCAPKSMMAIIPEEVRGRTYVHMRDLHGEDIVITGVIYSTYKAKKDGEHIIRQDGSAVLNTSMYILLDGNRYTTSKHDTVFSQLSVFTDYCVEEEGQHRFIFSEEAYIAASVTMERVRYGDKPVDVYYFDEPSE